MTEQTIPAFMEFYTLGRSVALKLKGYKALLGGVSMFNVFQTLQQKTAFAQLGQNVEQAAASADIIITELAGKTTRPS